MLRIAPLGAGRIGQLHARLVASEPDVSVVVSDVDVRRARELAMLIGAEVARSTKDALTVAGAVIIAASTGACRPSARSPSRSTCLRRSPWSITSRPWVCQSRSASAASTRPTSRPAGSCHQVSWERCTSSGSSPITTSRRPTTYPRVRRALPGLVHPWLRCPALGHPSGGRGVYAAGSVRGFSGVRATRRPCTPRDALQAMRASVAAGRSHLEHHSVSLDEV